MAKYTVQAPDGKTVTLEGPDGASESDVIAQAQKLYSPPAATPEIQNPEVRGDTMPPLTVDHGALDPNTGVYTDGTVHRNADGSLGAVADDAATKAGQAAAAGEASQPGATPFFTALKAGITRGAFGIPERLAAAGERYLPSAITGNTSNASYDDILKAVRAKTDAELSGSTGGNILGQIVGGGLTGGAVGKAVVGLGGRLAEAASPVVSRAGNFLQSLGTLNKGATLANAAKITTAGAAQGAAQAAGEGGNPLTGAAEGAAGAAVLGTGFKAAQVLTRPFRDLARLSSASRILGRITTATQSQLEDRAAQYRTATGAEPTLFELLPLADRNKILQQAVVGRDNVVEQASGAIRQRADNLGTEMRTRAQQILDPRRAEIQGQISDDLRTAGAPQAPEAVAAAATNPVDMEALRHTEAQAIMGPHENTPVVENLHDLFPSVPNPAGEGPAIQTDPEVSAVIRSAAGVLRQRPENGGVTAGDVSSIIETLRGDLAKGGIEGRTAERAINHLQDTMAENAPEAAAAHAQMTDAYAARSRMAEGMKEGAATRLRGDVQVGTDGRTARTVRNAYDTPEGTAGRVLGQGNKVLGSMAGTPEDALRATVQMSRNGTGRQLAQNVGGDEAAQLVAAARAQDTSAQALASASSKALGGSGDPAGAETLVSALAALHPASFVTTKLGALKAIKQMTVIPEGRARTIVNMIFSQDPAMVQRAMNAVGNEKNGAKFLQYLGKVGGTIGGDNAAQPAAPELPADPATEAAPAAAVPADPQAPADATAAPEAAPDPAAASASPYTPALQKIYDTESPEMLDLIGRVAGQESGGQQFDAAGNPKTSSAGAVGVMQVMPDTAPEAARLAGLPWDEQAYRNDPDYNKVLGIAYLSELLRKYDGDVAKALAAYNAGPGRADAALKMGDRWLAHLPAETQDYVQRVS